MNYFTKPSAHLEEEQPTGNAITHMTRNTSLKKKKEKTLPTILSKCVCLDQHLQTTAFQKKNLLFLKAQLTTRSVQLISTISATVT